MIMNKKPQSLWSMKKRTLCTCNNTKAVDFSFYD